MELAERMARAVKAREIMDNPIYLESFNLMKEEVIDQWQKSPVRDVEGREKLWLMLSIMEKFQSNLHRVIETGKLAQYEMGRERTADEQRLEYLSL